MTVEFSVISEPSELYAMRDDWRALAQQGGTGALFRGPDWLLPWWHAYHQVLHAELHVLVGREDGALVCLAPLYSRVARRAPGLKVHELRLLGDAGPRPPALDLLFAPGTEDRAAAALARYLSAREREQAWDVIDLEPLQDPSRGRGVLVSRLGNNGLTVQSQYAGGGARRIALAVAGIDVEVSTKDALTKAYVDDPAALRKGVSALKRLSRLEWALREEASPLADPEAAALIEEVTLHLGSEHGARLARLDDSSGEAIAAALVVDDGDRAVVLAMAVDPEHESHASARLLAVEARAAAERGRVALDVVTGAAEHPLPPLPVTRQRALSVRIYGNSAAAAMARTYGAVRKRVEAAREAPGTAAAGARAAWAKIRSTANTVAGYERMHLYRGELWTRGTEPTPGLTLATFSLEELEALDEHDRAEMVESLNLDLAACRQKWQRGDLAVLARLYRRPAGIAWCARSRVRVPELGRELNLGPAEAYIYDVYVAPQARGRAVAPSMLEFLSLELRQRDVYRGWALIGSDNAASVRAFEKAAYAAVADIVYAHLGNVDHISIRPPDPEAKQLLGLA